MGQCSPRHLLGQQATTASRNTYTHRRLIDVLQKFVDEGHTVVIIEHHPDIVKVADHIIDLGPEGGDRGGYIVVEGTPEEVAGVETSYTGQFLKKYLGPNGKGKPGNGRKRS